MVLTGNDFAYWNKPVLIRYMHVWSMIVNIEYKKV